MEKINSATFVEEITVIDPDTKGEVKITVFKHDQSGGMFAVDSSFIESVFEDDDTNIMLPDLFNNNAQVELSGV